jgi:N,N'-diacetyllegionaminate synthase
MKKLFEPYIIAEIGINHEGNILKAKKLINDAVESGASAVKFQVFETETILGPNLNHNKKKKKKLYIKKIAKKLYITNKQISELRKFSKRKKIDFGCSVFDKKSLERVIKAKVDYIKIASSDINDLYLLSLVKKNKVPCIISSGMANLSEIKRAIKVLGNPVVLHCVSSYPCNIKDANLKRINSLKKKLKTKIGYSDHTIGIDACKLAIMMGANVIEKHFTYDKSRGGDHALSADKYDMIKLVEFSKNFRSYYGNGSINPKQKEIKNKKIFRKGLYYAENLKKGKKIEIEDLKILRPENNFKIENYKKILGKVLIKKVKKFDSVNMNHFAYLKR